jgi:cytochrome b subunit of formate dehydrogenase
MAATVLLLLLTGLAPVLGWGWNWYGVHWVSGLLLTLIILLHIVRALFWQKPASMVPGGDDFRRQGAGKYTLAQKLMHLGWAVAILATIVTGLFLLRKAGVPFLERDPYVRSPASWGVLTLLHDLGALLAVFLILVHVYFGIIPEKRAYLRAMLTGFISRGALAAEHNVEKAERGE